MNLEDHPTVRQLREAGRSDEAMNKREPLGAEELLELARACGADDVGIVEIGRAELEPQRDEILRHYPWTRSLLSIIVKMAREPVRGTPRSVANLEFHRAGHEVNEVCARIVARLEDRGVRAVNPSMGLPMEMSRRPVMSRRVCWYPPQRLVFLLVSTKLRPGGYQHSSHRPRTPRRQAPRLIVQAVRWRRSAIVGLPRRREALTHGLSLRGRTEGAGDRRLPDGRPQRGAAEIGAGAQGCAVAKARAAQCRADAQSDDRAIVLGSS